MTTQISVYAILIREQIAQDQEKSVLSRAHMKGIDTIPIQGRPLSLKWLVLWRFGDVFV